MLQHTARERVEAQEVSDLPFVLDHIAHHNVISWQEEVRYFIKSECNVKRELLQVIIKELVYLLRVLWHHFPQTFYRGRIRQFLLFHVPGHRHICRFMRKPDI